MKPGHPRTELAAALLACLLLAGCGSGEQADGEPAPTPVKKAAAPAQPDKAGEEPVSDEGTPNEDRVATIAILNKRNNLTEEFTMKTGEARRFGKAVVRLDSCDRTPQWESPPEEAAFVRLFVEERAAPGEDEELRKVFSGWLFRNSPSLNVVEHPIYDVWVKKCTMRFPGEASPGASSGSSENASESDNGDSPGA